MFPYGGATALCAARVEVVLRPAEQRRDEQCGKVEIVERLHREAHRGDQILHRERLGQREAVDARDGDVQRLKPRDDPRRQIAASADEDHDIARRHGTPVLAVRDPVLHLARDRLGQPHRGGIGSGGAAVPLVSAVLRGCGIDRLADGQRRPEFDLAGLGASKRAVGRLFAVEPHRSRPAVAEPAVDDVEHRGRRAIVGNQIDLAEGLAAHLTQRVEHVARGRERLGLGALKAEDRLLAVADREQRPQPVVLRADAREKFLGKRQDNAPLAHIRILRLIDEDMVGALIELEAHPFAEAADS